MDVAARRLVFGALMFCAAVSWSEVQPGCKNCWDGPEMFEHRNRNQNPAGVIESIEATSIGAFPDAEAPSTPVQEAIAGLPCEGCEAVFVGMPANLESRARIAPRDEKGERMVLSGRVLDAQGEPRAKVIVYAYHTDAGGIYPRPAKSLGGAADRHGRLRGWALSDADGRYSFETIRPAPYPGGSAPAHVHMHVIERGCATYYIDEILFTDDPILKPQVRDSQPRRGGSGVVTPARVAGVWQVTRDIHLGRNIPGYPGCESH